MAATTSSNTAALADHSVKGLIVPGICERIDLLPNMRSVRLNVTAAYAAAAAPSENAAFSADDMAAPTFLTITPSALYAAEHAISMQELANYGSHQAAFEEIRKQAIGAVLKKVTTVLLSNNTSLTISDTYDGSDPLTLNQVRAVVRALRSSVQDPTVPVGVVLSHKGMIQLRNDLDSKTATFDSQPDDFVKALFPNARDAMHVTYLPQEGIYFFVDASGALPVSGGITYGAVVILPSTNAAPHDLAPTYACVNGPMFLNKTCADSELISYPWGNIRMDRLYKDGSGAMRGKATAFVSFAQIGAGYALMYTE